MSHPEPARHRRGRASTILACLLVVGSAGAAYWYYALRTVTVRYDDPLDRFEHGSLGTEAGGLPFAIWEALPAVCPDQLPGGYASLGFIYRPGGAQPIGISRRVVGVERVGINCASCHTGGVRETQGAPLQVVPGMPNHQLDFQRYLRFVLSCLRDPRFTPDNVLRAIEARRELSLGESVLYRYVVVPAASREAARAAPKLAWYDDRPDFGPGRADPPNSLRTLAGLAVPTGSIGTVDASSIWNQAARRTHPRHWDGSSPSVGERDHVAALLAGATPESIDPDEMRWVQNWLETLPPPQYPFAIDSTAAARGARLFEVRCASCHVARAGEVTPIELIATDRLRLDALSADLVAQLNTSERLRGNRSAHFRKTNGYANVLLDGVWARAPYLHNGAVPNMSELLEPAERRSRVFYTGSAVYDRERLGFLSHGAEAESSGFRFDTGLPGNGNGGHEYGTTLGPREKRDLIEYLKTL